MSHEIPPHPLSQAIAAELLNIGAVKLSPQKPFTWASGWLSPIYCDNRLTLSYPYLRTLITNALVDTIQKRYPGTQMIAGVATAGIPQGALVAEALKLPFVYVRDKPKAHGMTHQIEGRVQAGEKVFVIEDLISTGASAIQAVHALRGAQIDVLGLGAIFTYDFERAEENLRQAALSYFTLSGYRALLEAADQLGVIAEDERASLREWRKNPEAWCVNRD